jgi:hypothetical protein
MFLFKILNIDQKAIVELNWYRFYLRDMYTNNLYLICTYVHTLLWKIPILVLGQPPLNNQGLDTLFVFVVIWVIEV